MEGKAIRLKVIVNTVCPFDTYRLKRSYDPIDLMCNHLHGYGMSKWERYTFTCRCIRVSMRACVSERNLSYGSRMKMSDPFIDFCLFLFMKKHTHNTRYCSELCGSAFVVNILLLTVLLVRTRKSCVNISLFIILCAITHFCSILVFVSFSTHRTVNWTI